MLQQFTWQQFLVATLVLTLIWYLGVILVFYRNELKAFFNANAQSKKTEQPLPHRWEKGMQHISKEQEEEVMGRAELPEGMEIVEAGGFAFAGGDGKEDQVGLVPDVLAEIREVFRLIADKDAGKPDFFRLMEQVRENYPRIGGNPNIKRINEFIADHAPFHLSGEELENLWD